jgi:hypothetical protein
MLGTYADYGMGSEQYIWLQRDLAAVDRWAGAERGRLQLAGWLLGPRCWGRRVDCAGLGRAGGRQENPCCLYCAGRRGSLKLPQAAGKASPAPLAAAVAVCHSAHPPLPRPNVAPSRHRTPWVIALMHAPWYNSNYAHLVSFGDLSVPCFLV